MVKADGSDASGRDAETTSAQSALATGLVPAGLFMLGAATCILVLAGPSLMTVAGFGVVAIAVLCAVPIPWLPPIALIAFATLPLGYLNSIDQSLRLFISPSLLVMLVWAFRSMGSVPVRRQEARLAALLLVLTVTWATVSIPASMSVRQSVAWIVNFGALVVLPVLLSPRSREKTAAHLKTTWLLLASGLGVLAVVEKASGDHILGGLIPYSQLDIKVTWLTDRATTLMGHPLMNATFFAVATTLIAMWLLERPRPWMLVAGIASLSGLLLTVSRAGVAATVGALVIGFVLSLVRGHTSLGVRLTGIVVIATTSVILLFSPLLAERGQEGTVSSAVRLEVIDLALRIARQDQYLGSGPGTSPGRGVAAGLPVPIENSYLCLLISLGVVGLVLVVGALVALIGAATARGSVDVAAGMVAFCAVCGAWPVWDNRPVVWVILGSLVLLGFGRDRDIDARAPQRDAVALAERRLIKPPALPGRLSQ